ncbi:MAG: hypothetical protein RLZZ299_2127 [Pseudomonadota bacterium]
MRTTLERHAVLRLGIVLVILAWALFLVGTGGWRTDEGLPFVTTCSLGLLGVIAARAWARTHDTGRAFAYGQVVLDVLFATMLAWFTGGGNSLFLVAYMPAIAAGALLLGMRGALVAAVLASMAYLAMFGHHEHATGIQAVVAYSEATLRVFAFLLLGGLTGDLAERVARAQRDLASQRRSHEVLADEHGKVLARVRAGVLTTHPDGTVAAVNPFGRERVGDVIGTHIDTLFTRRDGRPHWEENRADGVHWICSEADLPDGGTVIVIDDVTELTRMRERAATDERLVAAGRLAASMAHEVRNPLASLGGALQLLREERPSRLLDLALSEAERLNRLVENFLGVTRRAELNVHPTDVTALAREVCDAFGQDARYRGRTAARVEGSAVLACVDADRVRQALWNLVINAAQAMPNGGTVDVRIDGADRDGNAGVSLAVSDRGVGIPDAERARVFDPFYTTRAGGTGLGLAVVDQAVRAHGGHVGVETRPGGGTTFRCWFPRGEDGHDAA